MRLPVSKLKTEDLLRSIDFLNENSKKVNDEKIQNHS